MVFLLKIMLVAGGLYLAFAVSGGVPPILVVEQKDGPPLYLLLMGADGRSINGNILDFVARPVWIVGEMKRQGQLLIFQADPLSVKLL